MTSGNILKHIIMFAVPLLIGNIFQQLYNVVDTWVVGNYVSNEAFAAVGGVTPIINTLIGLFMGLSSGAGVVISQYYGAKDDENVSKAVHTSILMTLVLGIAFIFIGIAITPTMVAFIKMPDVAVEDAITYLNIYFAGVVGLMLYNIGAGILRAIGDSRTPFYFICLSAVLNIVLDLLFVLVLDMKVAGVAIATVVSQFISAILVLIVLARSRTAVRFRISKLKMSGEMLAKIIRVGIPAGLQMAITAFSNVFVNSYINYFGEDCTSGWAAYVKIDQFILIPIQAISLAATTFVGQNLGIAQLDRAKKGIRISLLITVVSTVVLTLPIVIFAPQLVAFFNAKPEVVEYGTLLLRLMSPFYLACCLDMIFASGLRGSGNTVTPMIIMISSYVVFRQAYLFIVSNFVSNTITAIAFSYPAGWCIACVANIAYYAIVGLNSKRVVTKKI